MTDGTVTGRVPAGRATDTGGNMNMEFRSADNTVTYDTTAPVVTLTEPANNSYTSNPKPHLKGVGGQLSGDTNLVTINVYSGTSATGTPVVVLTDTAGAYDKAPGSNLADGTYTAQTVQTDAAGNIGTSSANTFTVDTVDPSVTINQAA